MSNEIQNGDLPANPQAVTVTPQGDVFDSDYAGGSGLTKRETAEIAAMQGLCVNMGRNRCNSPAVLAVMAAEIADELIKRWK